LDELANEPFIQRESGSGTRQIIEQYLGKHKPARAPSFNVVATLGSSTAVKEGVKLGLGVSILSRRAVEDEAQRGVLKIVLLEDLKLERHFFTIRDRRRTTSPLCLAFVNALLADAAAK
jgi:DNA-binding transcriptional LysR family regulator